MLTNVFLHLHPVSVRKSGIALSYTWCMGGITFFLFLVETVTGVLLMFYYRPTLEHAYNDILSLRDVATLGILRELHRWGAHAMVITIWLHMYRVFLTGSYKPPREFNWGVGVILLVLTLLLSFTGYLVAVGSAGHLGHHGRQQHGPGHSVHGLRRPRGQVPADRRRRVDPLRQRCALLAPWRPLRRRNGAFALLRAALRGAAIGRCATHRRAFLAREKGWGHQRRIII